jgi:hypothetical protein
LLTETEFVSKLLLLLLLLLLPLHPCKLGIEPEEKKSNFLKLRLNQTVTQSGKWAFVLYVVKLRPKFNGTK